MNSCAMRPMSKLETATQKSVMLTAIGNLCVQLILGLAKSAIVCARPATVEPKPYGEIAAVRPGSPAIGMHHWASGSPWC